MACNIIKLVDVQEMNYLAAKGEGEVSNFQMSRFLGKEKEQIVWANNWFVVTNNQNKTIVHYLLE